jgi:hypothetical protein
MKRYRPVIIEKKPKMLEDESGDYTSLTDYYTLHDRVVRAESQVAYLQAEVERLKLKMFTSEELVSTKAEVELLQAQFKRDIYNQALAENERLRKAGDAFLGVFLHASVKGLVTQDEAVKVIEEWKSAKGVQP